jgi:hypothetical protein
MKLLIRFRITPNGFEVFNGGKWVVADLTVQTNVAQIMLNLGRR